jgi:hypothetical protein
MGKTYRKVEPHKLYCNRKKQKNIKKYYHKVIRKHNNSINGHDNIYSLNSIKNNYNISIKCRNKYYGQYYIPHNYIFNLSNNNFMYTNFGIKWTNKVSCELEDNRILINSINNLDMINQIMRFGYKDKCFPICKKQLERRNKLGKYYSYN